MKLFKKITSALCAAAMAAALIPAATPPAVAAETLTKAEILKKMGLGWNLGNTFECSNCSAWIKDDLYYENAWNNPTTTKELIKFVHESGFSTIRIPVSWGEHMHSSDYTISKQWMTRVHTIVDMALDEGMYVIINIHHDNTPHTQEFIDRKMASQIDNKFFYPNSTYKTQSLNYVSSVWEQLCEEYKDYDQHLIFETLNEPRLIGHQNEWGFTTNNPESDVREAIGVINELNQKAVDTIRSSGGNNKTRLIMCPGYCASIDGAVNPYYVLPSDKSDMTVASVHAYTPYSFALDKNGTSSFTSDLYSQLDYLFDCLDKLEQKGISSVIGEFGAMDKNNSDERVKWAEYYTKRSSERGIPAVLWDNNVYPPSDGETFGLISRSGLEVSDTAFLKALTKYYPQECSHSWDEGKVKSAPTLEKEGEITYTCTKCGDTKTQTLPKLINIANAEISGLEKAYYHTGSYIMPSVTVTLDKTTLTLNRDYEIVYKNCRDKGTAAAAVYGKGLYGGELIAEFEITDRIAGDVDRNGKINMADLTRLQQYLADWDVSIDESNADLDGTSGIKMSDLTRLQQYLADWDVTLV